MKIPNWIAIPAIVGFVLLLAACDRGVPVTEQAVRPVRAIKVGEAGPLADRWFPGQARAHNEADLSFRVSGPLIVLPNDIVGREFKAGEVIARIDPRDYEVKVADIEAQAAKAFLFAKKNLNTTRSPHTAGGRAVQMSLIFRCVGLLCASKS
ncbi:MAG: hypothetical protein WBN48_10650 [Thiogranum sp.]